MDDAAESSVSALMGGVAGLLFTNGQTTEATHLAIERLGTALCHSGRLTARWGELTIWRDGEVLGWHHAAEPLAVDIGKVLATERLVDEVCAGRIDVREALVSLPAIRRLPPVSLIRFATMAASGAAALAIIFGAADALTIATIAASAGAGACVRRAISHVSRNPFVQSFLAALLAGGVGSIAISLALPVSYRLVAVCPCMVLVPGPHFLNGMIDLARARIPLGASRVGFASLVAVVISAGLLLGLSAATTTLPGAGPTPSVPLPWDVCAAGVAVASYGSFFNMPWRTVPIPICMGVFAHALRWELLSVGASLQLGAFLACLLVGTVMTLVAHRFRMPFGALAFVSVVSLIPGVFMFQAASEALELIDLGANVSLATLTGFLRDGATASLVLLAMASGLIIPRMCFDLRTPTAASPKAAGTRMED
jgi:uncharacterized membrane protein YjjP (DUF1212 family)